MHLSQPANLASLIRLYRCQCGGPVFFSNNICLRCNTALGYEPARGRISPLIATVKANTMTIIGDEGGELFQYCSNNGSAASCNWLVKVEDEFNPQALCISCRLNRMIPNLTGQENRKNWHRIEHAKRRLVSTLLALGLPVKSRVGEDRKTGLAFDFLSDSADGPHVITGHSDGIITLNVAEADHATRESVREQMQEPYRTVLGHLRHEVGHYYWDRLVDGTSWLDGFRELFGDERQDYAAALEKYYKQGPSPDWQFSFVSSYATSHPWEDWAETWAHYLHIVDTLEIAFSFGLDIESVEMPFEAFGPEVLVKPDTRFLQYLNSWARFTAVLNEFSRSMGLLDFYPFVLSIGSVRKVHFVHMVVEAEWNKAQQQVNIAVVGPAADRPVAVAP